MHNLTDVLLPAVIKYGVTANNIATAINWLKTFNYIKDGASKEETQAGLSDFQKTYGLESNGEFNPKTLKAMEWFRCGNGDAGLSESERLRGKWNKKHLTFYIKNRDTKEISTEEWDKTIINGWNGWAEVCGLTFERVQSQGAANVVCDVGMGQKDNFDGPSGTLAWAWLPNGSDNQLLVKFDISETWIVNPRDRGILLLNVARHEFGHSLGLEHSKVKQALMAPYYSHSIDRPQENDDIPRIQSLYGRNTSPTPTPAPSPTPNEPEDKDIVVIKVPKKTLEVVGYRLTPVVR